MHQQQLLGLDLSPSGGELVGPSSDEIPLKVQLLQKSLVSHHGLVVIFNL